MFQPLFWLSSVAMIVSALGVVLSREAIQSVLWMFALLLGLGGAASALGASLLGLIIVLVYAGAILVLFTFVVMFVGQRAPHKQIGRWRLLWGLMFAVVAVLFFAFLALPTLGINRFAPVNSLSRTGLYGAELFARYQLPAMLMGWLLLWVAVGAFDVLGGGRKESR